MLGASLCVAVLCLPGGAAAAPASGVPPAVREDARPRFERSKAVVTRLKYRVSNGRAVRATRAGAVRAGKALAATRAGQAGLAATRGASYGAKVVASEGTLLLDWFDVKLSPRLPGGAMSLYRGMRHYNPFALFSYSAHNAKHDRAFLLGWTALSVGLTSLQTPLLTALGLGAGVAFAVRLLTITPLKVSMFFWRERARLRRKHPDVTFGQTLVRLHREFKVFVGRRQAENRAFMSEQAEAHPLLRAISEPLVPREQPAAAP